MATTPTIEDTIREYRAAFDPRHHQATLATLGKVNAIDFAGHPAGMLMLIEARIDRDGPALIFHRNESRPWNFVPTRDGLRELLDPSGNTPFTGADFEALDGFSKTLDLVERKKWTNTVCLPCPGHSGPDE
jgi:hypothetical protein